MFPGWAASCGGIPIQVPSGGELQDHGDKETSTIRLLVWCLLLVLCGSLRVSARRRVLLPIYPPCCSGLAHLVFIWVPSGGGMALPQLSSDAGWGSGNAEHGSPSSFGAAMLLLQYSGPKPVPCLLTNYLKSPLVTSCYFQDKEWAQMDLCYFVLFRNPSCVL